jgi:hypothetical protein
MGYVVEFCGLPGAGKSTLARAVVAQLRLRAIPTTDVMVTLGPDAGRAARVARKVGAIGRAAFEPGSAALAANVGLRSGQRHARDRFARPANLLVVRHVVRRAHGRPGIHILDQGPVQEWWSAALRADDATVLGLAEVDPAERSDLLVRIDAPLDLLVERLGARGPRQSRLEGLDPGDRLRELKRGELLLDSLSDQLVHSPGVHAPAIQRIDGLDPTAAETIAEIVAGRA